MEKNKKSYYVVIPSTVMYDDRIMPNAKLLYGEIVALCNEKGYCWETNEYFSSLYKVSKRAISSWIKSLCDAGYVSCEFHSDNINPKIKIRCLRVEEIFYTHRRFFHEGYSQKQLRGIVENNQEENNRKNNINSSSKILKDEISQQNREEIIQEKGIEAKTKLTCCSSKEKTIFDQKAKQKRKCFSADSIPYLLAKHLERCIQIHSPAFPSKEAQRQRWAKDIDLMLRIDKLDPDDVARTIQWCQQDNFWKSNILSGKKLREKYQQLRIKMEV